MLVATGVTETGQVRPITFPVAGPVRYSNDFGACRAGCSRQHKGNDIIGDRLQPLLAMRDGVVDRLLDHPTAGYGVVIQDAEGWEYHIYHVNNDSPGTDDGADDGVLAVRRGHLPRRPGDRPVRSIAWMGDSGNSEGSVPHAHVEIHTPSGAAVNPFWSLRMAQRDVNCAIPTIVDPATAARLRTRPPRPSRRGARRADPGSDVPPGWLVLPAGAGVPAGGVAGAVGHRRSAGIDVDGGPHVDRTRRASRRSTTRRCASATLASTRTAASLCRRPRQIPAELGAILATIRAMETGGNYTTQVTSSTASGAYGFLDGSWGRLRRLRPGA